MNESVIPATEYGLPGGGKLFVAPTGAKDVVAVEGSVFGGENMLPALQRAVPGLVAELLDAGTKGKKKSVIREGLASRGITLSFTEGGDRTYFSGQCFPEDLPYLLSTVVECLGGASFPEAELKSSKTRELGALAEEKTDTRAQAERALSNLLYEPSHVNFIRPLAMEETGIRKARRGYLEAFRKMLGKGGLVLAITGDVDAVATKEAVLRTFGKLSKGTPESVMKKLNAKRGDTEERRIPISDKANIDVLIGASLGVTTRDDSYHALQVLTGMLGGSAASYLFQTIRERDGLTYGVYARLAGLADKADGYLKVWATFSPERYEESVAKLRFEIREFFSKGLTDEALVRKHDEIAGSYMVSLSTTRGLARTLHSIGVEERDLSYLVEYPNIIRALSLADVKRVADIIPVNRLSLAAAGTFPTKDR